MLFRYKTPSLSALLYVWCACVQILMQQGVGFMEHNNLPLALEAFDAACKLEPSFAEVSTLVAGSPLLFT